MAKMNKAAFLAMIAAKKKGAKKTDDMKGKKKTKADTLAQLAALKKGKK